MAIQPPDNLLLHNRPNNDTTLISNCTLVRHLPLLCCWGDANVGTRLVLSVDKSFPMLGVACSHALECHVSVFFESPYSTLRLDEFQQLPANIFGHLGKHSHMHRVGTNVVDCAQQINLLLFEETGTEPVTSTKNATFFLDQYLGHRIGS
ncbi:hypothetical protein HG531_008037 [Fusarium graminearum]|nr:hypothetical protein HG531_008037 [Fusarium graminearum]